MLSIAFPDTLESTIISSEEDCSRRVDGSGRNVSPFSDLCASELLIIQ